MEGKTLDIGGNQRCAVSSISGHNTLGLRYCSLVSGAAMKSHESSKKHQWLSLGGSRVEWAVE